MTRCPLTKEDCAGTMFYNKKGRIVYNVDFETRQLTKSRHYPNVTDLQNVSVQSSVQERL